MSLRDSRSIRPSGRFTSRWPGLLLLVLLWLASLQAFAQARQDRDGVTLYWGLVPAAIVDDKHAVDELHGGPRKDGGHAHHLVVAVFDTASGRRIGDAIVRAQLTESGIVDEPPKYLPQMPVNGQMSYGQWFTTVAASGPYRFRVFVKLADRPREIEFVVSAGVPHGETR
jgi:hypothetical protein